MVPLIESKRDEIAKLCRRFHLRRLEVFGSAARGDDFVPETSDIDFLFEFDPGVAVSLFRGYFPFKEALEDLFGRAVDLVQDGAVENPYILKNIERSREPVFGA